MQSQTFARADQLKKFLRYICEMEMAGRGEEITEYSIAVDALGRREDYSPAGDSTVRGRAHDLRLKLQQFYHLECLEQGIRITLHKGSYIPRFLPSDLEDKPAEIPDPETVREAAPLPRRRSRAGLVVAVLLATGIIVAVLVRVAHPGESDPMVKRFWGPLLSPNGGVLLCLGNPSAFVFKRFRVAPRSGAFRPAPPEIAEWMSDVTSLEGGTLPFIFRAESPMFGDSAAAVVAARTLSAAGVPFQFLAEASVRPAVLRGRNVLLIGAPSYSTYAARALRSAPFTIRFDSATSEEVISDAPPESKPKRVFTAKRDEAGALAVAYGLVTVFPSEPAMPDGPRTALFSGITGAGAQAAMEFFSSNAGLGLLWARLQRDGIKRVPSSYQVVVRCTVDHGLLINWDFAAYQVIDHPPMLD